MRLQPALRRHEQRPPLLQCSPRLRVLAQLPRRPSSGGRRGILANSHASAPPRMNRAAPDPRRRAAAPQAMIHPPDRPRRGAASKDGRAAANCETHVKVVSKRRAIMCHVKLAFRGASLATKVSVVPAICAVGSRIVLCVLLPKRTKNDRWYTKEGASRDSLFAEEGKGYTPVLVLFLFLGSWRSCVSACFPSSRPYFPPIVFLAPLRPFGSKNFYGRRSSVVWRAADTHRFVTRTVRRSCPNQREC